MRADYRVELQRSAERDLGRLAPSLVVRILDRIAELGTDPRSSNAEKLAGLDAYRARIGDYRVIYEIDDAARLVRVVRIRHRREVYRRL